MDRFSARVHHALEVAIIGAHQHAAREQIARIKAADRLQVQIPFVADMADKKADFVHVAQQHDLRRVRFVGVTATQERSHRIDCDLVKQAVNLAHDQLAHAVFMARHTWHFTQLTEKFGVHFRHWGVLSGRGCPKTDPVAIPMQGADQRLKSD